MSSARADALTIRDVVELTRAGLGDEVLLALIEVDPSVFPIDTETLKYLKEAGVSQRVIVAMVRSARTPPPPVAPEPFITQVAPQAPEPQVVVIDHHEPERVREVPVAVPVYIPFRSCRHSQDRVPSTSVAIDRVPDTEDRCGTGPDSSSKPDHPSRHAPPVYWGTSGKLRPDAWQAASSFHASQLTRVRTRALRELAMAAPGLPRERAGARRAPCCAKPFHDLHRGRQQHARRR